MKCSYKMDKTQKNSDHTEGLLPDNTLISCDAVNAVNTPNPNPNPNLTQNS